MSRRLWVTTRKGLFSFRLDSGRSLERHSFPGHPATRRQNGVWDKNGISTNVVVGVSRLKSEKQPVQGEKRKMNSRSALHFALFIFHWLLRTLAAGGGRAA